MTRNVVVTAIVAVVIVGFVLTAKVLTRSAAPPITGYAEGQKVSFIHTEASNPQIADLLTKVKHSLDVNSMSLTIYQGRTGNRPLRRLDKVTWKSAANPRELRSAAELKEAEAKGEITLERPGVVINMPLLTWPSGKR